MRVTPNNIGSQYIPYATGTYIQAQVSTDYTQAIPPMQLGSSGSFSSMMVLGTTNCAQTLSPSGSATDCGLQGASVSFGSCGHLDIDEASGYVTCGNQASFGYNNGALRTMPVRRTMLVSLAPAFFNSPMLASGLFQMSGGVRLRSQ